MTRRMGWSTILSLVLVMSACGDADSPTGATTSTMPTTTITTTVPSTPAAPPTDVAWPVDGWPVASPESQGMDSSALAQLVEQLSVRGGVDSLTVIRNGYLVVDTVFHPFPADARHNVYSVTKSVVGTLIGIAIDRGLLGGVDVPVVEILADAAPDQIDDLKASVTVGDLLMMAPGFECRDDHAYNYEGLVALRDSEDWTAHILALPMMEEPGTRFEYCNQASFLLSAILSEVTGTSAAEFAGDALFGPLGIDDVEWPANPSGVSVGFSDLELQPRDMAKLGYLYLHRGWWGDEQIVSQEWVDAATSEQIDVQLTPQAYGYQWWVYSPLGYVMAMGHGGQYIVLDEAHGLIVVTTANDAPFTAQGLTSELFNRAVMSDEPLTPNTEGEARLAAAVTSAAAGPDATVVGVPERAAAISGVRYDFRPNELGLDWIALEFGGEGAVLELGDGVEQRTFDVGLDGRYAVTTYEVPVAMRGRWLGDDTFVISIQDVGFADPVTVQLRFVDDHVRVWVNSTLVNETIIAEPAG